MSGNRRVQRALQDRDWKLFRCMVTMRVVDREHARIIGGFGSTTRVNEWLLKLTRAGYLKRRFFPLKHGGSQGLYSLSKQGAALVDAAAHTLNRKPARAAASELFLEHQLAINSIHILVKYRPIPVSAVSFVKWRAFQEPLSPAVSLIPDGYFELQTTTGMRAQFLEVDLGTEALRIWKQKIESYLHLATSGEFTKKFGHSQFRVLVICQSAARLESIRKLVSSFTEKIFWFGTFEIINRDGFWSPTWLRPRGDQFQSLI